MSDGSLTFDGEWGRCAPWLQAALDRLPAATHSLDDVKDLVICGKARFWAGRSAAMVTELNEYPRLTTFNFWLAGGDLAELRDELRPQAEDHYRALGATWGTVVGRLGWARALGYRPLHFTCAKEL